MNLVHSQPSFCLVHVDVITCIVTTSHGSLFFLSFFVGSSCRLVPPAAAATAVNSLRLALYPLLVLAAGRVCFVLLFSLSPFTISFFLWALFPLLLWIPRALQNQRA